MNDKPMSTDPTFLNPSIDWDQRYQNRLDLPPPAWILAQHLHLLPAQGQALDLACGLGANALLLARQGLETTAWDVSSVAIERLRQQAAQQHLRVQALQQDVLLEPPKPNSFDVIVISRFLERTLIPHLFAALRPNGLLFYQTFTRNSVHAEYGPRNPSYRLANNELLQLCQGLQIVVYREEGRWGDISQGLRDEAGVIAAKVL